MSLHSLQPSNTLFSAEPCANKALGLFAISCEYVLPCSTMFRIGYMSCVQINLNKLLVKLNFFEKVTAFISRGNDGYVGV